MSLPGGDFFRSCFTAASSRRQQNLSKNAVFVQDFRRHVREFFGAVLELAPPSEAWCFPAGR